MKSLLLKQDQFIIIPKKKTKGIYGKATIEQLKELQEEGIETQSISWIEDNEN